jgi:pimeloyl-ACP methyl ester carboxylesterase
MLRALFRTIFWVFALLAVAIGGFRLAADQRERFTAADLVPDGGGFVETAHGRLHAIEMGPVDGVPVLLIHGSVGWAGLWVDTMEELAAHGYRAIALDLPPMGLSDRDNFTDYSRQAQALRILAFAEARGVRPILVAHSFGAGAAAEALLAEPQSFEGAVIIAGALALGKDGTGQNVPPPLGSDVVREIVVANSVTNPYLTRPLLGRFVHREDMITDAQVAAIEYPFTRQGTTDTIARWLPTLLVPPRGATSSKVESYAGLSVPMALIWGREDTVTPPDQAVQLQDAIGDVPLFWMEDVGHIPQIEAPSEFYMTLDIALSVVGPAPVTPEN